MSGGDTRFGQWLQHKLEERRLSLAQLCRDVDCDYTYLWRIIHADTARGRRYTRPGYELTRRVGEALGAPQEALAAAGYTETVALEDARVADRLQRVEQDLAALRASVDQREPASPSAWTLRRVPLLGHVQAGELREALENPDDWMELPELVLGDGEFTLRVRGDSMNPTLLDGDFIAARRQPVAEPGQLVVTAMGDQVTLKRYLVIDGAPTLVADNPEYGEVPLSSGARIVGVVTGSYRPPEVLRRRP